VAISQRLRIMVCAEVALVVEPLNVALKAMQIETRLSAGTQQVRHTIADGYFLPASRRSANRHRRDTQQQITLQHVLGRRDRICQRRPEDQIILEQRLCLLHEGKRLAKALFCLFLEGVRHGISSRVRLRSPTNASGTRPHYSSRSCSTPRDERASRVVMCTLCTSVRRFLCQSAPVQSPHQSRHPTGLFCHRSHVCYH